MKIKVSPSEGLRIRKPNSPETYQAGDEVVVTKAITKLLRDGDLVEFKKPKAESKPKPKTSSKDKK